MLVGNGRDFSNIDQAKCRIAGAFDPYELGLFWSDEVCNIYFNARRECDLYAVCCCDLCEIAMGTAVDIGYGNDMGALGEGLENCGCCCRARRES